MICLSCGASCNLRDVLRLRDQRVICGPCARAVIVGDGATPRKGASVLLAFDPHKRLIIVSDLTSRRVEHFPARFVERRGAA